MGKRIDIFLHRHAAKDASPAGTVPKVGSQLRFIGTFGGNEVGTVLSVSGNTAKVQVAQDPRGKSVVRSVKLGQYGAWTATDALNHLGEREYQTYGAWRAAAKTAGAVRFEGNKDIAHAFNAAGEGVGEWYGDKGSIYKTTRDARPAVLEKEVRGWQAQGYKIVGENENGVTLYSETHKRYVDLMLNSNKKSVHTGFSERDADPWRVTIRVRGKNLVQKIIAPTAEAAQLKAEKQILTDYGRGVDYNVIRVERSSEYGDAGNFSEGKHKRDPDGKFGSGGGGGKKSEPAKSSGGPSKVIQPHAARAIINMGEEKNLKKWAAHYKTTPEEVSKAIAHAKANPEPSEGEKKAFKKSGGSKYS